MQVMIDSFSLHLERNNHTKNLNVWNALGENQHSEGRLKMLVHALVNLILRDLKEEYEKQFNHFFHTHAEKVYPNDQKPYIVLQRLLVFNLQAYILDAFSASHVESQKSSAIRIRHWYMSQKDLSAPDLSPLKFKPFFDKFGEGIAKVLFSDNPTSIPALLAVSAANQAANAVAGAFKYG